MKFIRSLCIIIISLFVFPLVSNAYEINYQSNVTQGNTFKIKILEEDFDKVTANFDNQNIEFFKIQEAPKDFQYINRQEFARLIFTNINLGKIDVSDVPQIADVDDNNINNIYLKQAAKLKIFPLENNKISPYQNITRGEIAEIFSVVFNPKKIKNDQLPFIDIIRVNPKYPYIINMYQAGLMNGYPDNTFRPNQNITYGEINSLLKKFLHKESINNISSRNYFQALVGINRQANIGNKEIALTFYDNKKYPAFEKINVNINKKYYKTQKFSVNNSIYKLGSPDLMDFSWNKLNEAKYVISGKLWTEKFIRPVGGKITLGFGDIIFMNGQYFGSHFGIDYAIGAGTPIFASNNGYVALSEYLPTFGNTVFINHGQNVYSLYLHLTKSFVNKGDFIEKNQQIGTVGSTGLSSGPHLHFTMIVNDTVVNPDEWINVVW